MRGLAAAEFVQLTSEHRHRRWVLPQRNQSPFRCKLQHVRLRHQGAAAGVVIVSLSPAIDSPMLPAVPCCAAVKLRELTPPLDKCWLPPPLLLAEDAVGLTHDTAAVWLMLPRHFVDVTTTLTDATPVDARLLGTTSTSTPQTSRSPATAWVRARRLPCLRLWAPVVHCQTCT